MENILMRFLREQHRQSYRMVAEKLDIRPKEYRDIERGQILLTPEQAAQLGKLYQCDPRYIYESAQQLDLLLARRAIINMLKNN